MRPGCNTVLFSSQPLAGALARAAWSGFDEVELASIPGMAEHIAPGRDEPAALRDAFAQAGVRAVAIEAATNLLDPNNLPRFIAVLQLASQIGVGVVNTGGGGRSDDPESEQAVQAVIKQLAPQAHDLGVKLGIKAHVNQAIYNTASALRALEAVDLPGWGINYDASHLYRVGDDVVYAAQKLGPHIASVHIRDTLEQVIPIGPPPTQIPGRGRIPLKDVVSTLQQVGYQGPINLEVIGAGSLQDWQSVAIAAESRGYLHRIFDELADR